MLVYLQLLLLMVVAMGYFLYKNKHRAKAFLLSFIAFEGLLVIEVSPMLDSQQHVSSESSMVDPRDVSMRRSAWSCST